MALAVIDAAASEARNTASAASSSTFTNSLRGWCTSITSRTASAGEMLCALTWSAICLSTSGVFT